MHGRRCPLHVERGSTSFPPAAQLPGSCDYERPRPDPPSGPGVPTPANHKAAESLVHTVRVGIFGWGALGSAIGSAIAAGCLPGAQLAAIATRRPPSPQPPGPLVSAEQLPTYCDVVVEAAGHVAAREHIPAILASGTRVLLLSTGVLRDPAFLEHVAAVGRERLLLSSGAIGGVDLIGACRQVGAIERITLRTTKPPLVVRQDWMDAAMRAELEAGERSVECFAGPALEATARFPTSVNVAAGLALAAGSWDLVHVVVTGDPAASGNRHRIEITADAGEYSIELSNNAMPTNPASSALVVGSALRGLASLVTTDPHFV